MKKIAVLYLARAAEGLEKFERFAQSYKQHPAGQDHDLIIIYKGDFKKGEMAGAKFIFRDIPHQSFSIPDDGFDIHAYLYAAERIQNEYICPFNTHTEIVSADWLKKLYTHLQKPGVGLVGTSASYGSHSNGLKILHHMHWLYYNEKVSFQDKKHIRDYSATFLGPSPQRTKYSLKHLSRLSLKKVIMLPIYFCKKAIKKINTKTVSHKDTHLMRDFQKYWGHTLNETSASYVKSFFSFPNPHIRTNGFMVERKILLEFKGLGKTKIDCYIFEAGIDSLTSRIAQKGLSVLFVGADGIGYPPKEWPKSNNFWMGDQENLMISDNQTSQYMNLSKNERRFHSYLSWGDYTGYPLELLVKLGHQMKKSSQVEPSFKKIKISIVIPTHNRLEYLKEAVFSVLQQPYSNWEIVVFDNASSEPIEDYLTSLNDKRIRYKRSAEFLPVTDSWNKAMGYATGDYVIMLGDDDGLAPEYMNTIIRYAREFNEPDFIYSGRYFFVHPGAQTIELSGYLDSSHYGFFFFNTDKSLRNEAYLLNPNDAHKAWNDSIECRRSFSFSMQAFTFNRNFLEKIKIDGKLFHSLFPDYYLANIAMAYGKTMLICPERIVIQGVSTASYGYMLFNNLEKQGDKFLNIQTYNDKIFDTYKKYLLPGSSYQDKYIITMGHVVNNVPKKANAKCGINRYRRYQIFCGINKNKPMNWLFMTDDGKNLWKHLSLTWKVWTLFMTLLLHIGKKVKIKGLGIVIRNMDMYTSDKLHYRLVTGEFSRLSEVFNFLTKEEENPKKTTQISKGRRKSQKEAANLRKNVATLRNKTQLSERRRKSQKEVADLGKKVA